MESIPKTRDILISVIITCFNQEKLIEKAIESIKNQTYKSWECIIVDDGSTDNSAEVIKKLIQGDSRFIYLNQKNSGVSAARNLGFTKAKGTYIQILDGDDWLLPEKFSTQLEHFHANSNIDISYTNHQYFFEATRTYKTFHFETLEKRPLKQFLYKWHDTVAIPIHAYLFKREIWSTDEPPFPPDYSGREEDWIFNILVAMKNVNYYYLDKILCVYFVGETNFTSSILNSCVHAIDAAYYINNFIPREFQENFRKKTIEKILFKFHNSNKAKVLQSSLNWKLGNLITKPFFVILKGIKKLHTINQNK